MAIFHSVSVRAHCHATENVDKVVRAIENVMGFPIRLNKTITSGYYGNEIVILEGRVDKARDVEKFWENIREVHPQILAEIDDLVDNNCNLYLRFDKQLAYLGELVLRRGGDTIAIRCKVKCYPANREKCVKIIEDSIEEFMVGSHDRS